MSNANENWYIILYDLFSGLSYIATCGPFCKEATHIDLSKAFDTLTHSIRLDKMSFYGVNSVAYDLLKSYLTQKQQVVEYNMVVYLINCLIKVRVSQDSVLGPFLFVLL